MIRIHRDGAVPAALEAGAALVDAMHSAVAADPADAGSRASPFEFDSKVYGHKDVKDALKAMQHGKCAYCEGDFLAYCYGDIEHFRPKGFSQQARGAPRIYPGYYWLAYDWDNLVLSCELCNRARKRNIFPLANPARRAREPSQTALEDPLLLDPTGNVDPRDHIRFVGNVPEAKSELGRRSIDLYGLDRSELNGLRLKHLGHAKALASIVLVAQAPDAPAGLQQEAENAAATLATFSTAASEFSSMITDFMEPTL